MIRKFTLTALCALTASPVIAGGWETGTLDTTFLYEGGNYVELSYGSLEYSLNGTIQGATTPHNMAKDQSRVSFAGKLEIGNLDIGLASFDSGAIQMNGYAASSSSMSVVPDADVSLTTDALLGRYKVNQNFSAIGGFRRVNLKKSSVSTLNPGVGQLHYNINADSGSGPVFGFAYEKSEIALKLEVLQASKIELAPTGGTTIASAKIGVPETTTIKFQTGIAEDTLLMASAHKAKWAPSQVVIVGNGVPNQSSSFINTTRYGLGLGRKLSENTSASITYSWEDGAGATSASPFTMSNGSKSLSIGLKHTIDAISISGGLSYAKAGDVKVIHETGTPPSPSGLTSTYKDNSVTAFGVKIGYNF